MADRMRDERGITLIELIVAATMMLLIFGATLSLLTSAMRHQKLTEEHNEAQEQSRTAIERLARELRNMAAPTDLATPAAGIGTQPRSVDRNLPYDLVFQTVAKTKPAGSLNVSNVQRVRYCLNETTGALWRQQQTWTTAAAEALPADGTACPGPTSATAWDVGQDYQLASDVVNRANGQDRSVFRYSSDTGWITATDSVARSRVSRIRADVIVDPTPTRAPVESRLTAALFLRNQNREPVGELSATPINSTQRLVDLNASASLDPEAQTLSYQFYIDPPTTLPDCTTTPTPTSCIGNGGASRHQYIAPDLLSHRYVVKVTDTSGLSATAEQVTGFTP